MKISKNINYFKKKGRNFKAILNFLNNFIQNFNGILRIYK